MASGRIQVTVMSSSSDIVSSYLHTFLSPNDVCNYRVQLTKQDTIWSSAWPRIHVATMAG